MRKLYAPTVLGLVLAGGAAWAAARQPWVHVTIGDGKVPGSVLDLAGATVLPPLPALGLVILAAGLGVLASSGGVRQGVGLLIALTAVSGFALCVPISSAMIDRRAATSPAFFGAGDWTRADTPWRWATLAMFGFAALLGIVVMVCARRWPAMSARYDAPTREVSGDEPADLWKALDDGDDPTQ